MNQGIRVDSIRLLHRVNNQANRIISFKQITPEVLSAIEAEDILGEIEMQL